jgi:hypothetical protein
MMIFDELDPGVNGPRVCYAWAGECEVIDGINYYIPSIIFDDFGVQFPLRLKDAYTQEYSGKNIYYYYYSKKSKPQPTFLWGKSTAEIRLICKQMNAEIGLTESDVQEIIGSAIRAIDRQRQ